MSWELCWRGLAAGDRNGGPVRLATLLYQSSHNGFDEELAFKAYADWVLGDGFDTGPTLQQVVGLHRLGLSISDAVRANHRSVGDSAGIAPAHRSAALLMRAQGEELIDLALREAQLSHWDPVAGQCSAASLMLCEGLLNASSMSALHNKIEKRFVGLQLQGKNLSSGGYAPDVLAAAWHFTSRSESFDQALEPALKFAGTDNYCPVLVGLWAASRWFTCLL